MKKWFVVAGVVALAVVPFAIPATGLFVGGRKLYRRVRFKRPAPKMTAAEESYRDAQVAQLVDALRRVGGC